QDNIPQVIIKFTGGNISEVDGRNNQRPYGYWEQIRDLFEKQGWPTESYHYRGLETAIQTNERFENDQRYRNELIRNTAAGRNLSTVEMLSTRNRNLPEVNDAAVQGWLGQLNRGHQTIQKDVPDRLLANPELFEDVKNRWSRYIRQHISGLGLNNMPQPRIMRDADFAAELKDSVLQYLGRRPNVNFLLRIPFALINDREIIDAARETVLASFRQQRNITNIEPYWASGSNIFDAYKNDQEILDLRRNAWADHFAERGTLDGLRRT
ncbi:unnamed protein product, partial [marine sediment metagenome]